MTTINVNRVQVPEFNMGITKSLLSMTSKSRVIKAIKNIAKIVFVALAVVADIIKNVGIAPLNIGARLINAAFPKKAAVVPTPTAALNPNAPAFTPRQTAV